eukprot:1179689-Prorocentrum_minimum.AAC.1
MRRRAACCVVSAAPGGGGGGGGGGDGVSSNGYHTAITAIRLLWILSAATVQRRGLQSVTTQLRNYAPPAASGHPAAWGQPFRAWCRVCGAQKVD